MKKISSVIDFLIDQKKKNKMKEIESIHRIRESSIKNLFLRSGKHSEKQDC